MVGKKRPVSFLKAIKYEKRRKGDGEEQDDIQMDEFVDDSQSYCWSNILVSDKRWMDG